MVSYSTIQYRKGFSFQFRGETYAYSLEYFMRHFVEYSEKRADEVAKISRTKMQDIPITSINDLFQASQSIIGGNKSLEACSFQNRSEFFTFIINNRPVICPHNSNCYFFDDALLEAHPRYFDTDQISYLQIARFIKDKMQNINMSDAVLADAVIKIINGEIVDDNIIIGDTVDVLPVMIAALFIAEAKRNPSCFIPSLMLLDLIRHEKTTPLGDVYRWSNSLQDNVLVNQNNEISFFTDFLAPFLVGTPSRFELENGKKRKLEKHEKALINADKKHNEIKNQKEISSSEYLVQLGGYFPNSHRFSFSELKSKRSELEVTLSDKKSFIIISDWLVLKGIAETIHRNVLYKRKYPNLDTEKSLLTEVVFPEIWRSSFQFDTPNFNSVLNLSPSYPSIFTRFGCKQSKATADKVANTLFLIGSGSPDKGYGEQEAKKIKQQFQFWIKNNKGCDLLLTSLPPEKNKLNELHLFSKAGYILNQRCMLNELDNSWSVVLCKKLYYVNLLKNQLISLEISEENFKNFCGAIQANKLDLNIPKTLSFSELAKIAPIINHSHNEIKFEIEDVEKIMNRTYGMSQF